MSDASQSFREWIRTPQVLVGLSALVLSLCGLFISIYETKLVREEQRASVWPHVAVGVSVNAARVRFHVRNTGVGPGRVRAAAVSHEGEVADGWPDMLRDVAGEPVSLEGRTLNLIDGAVLPPGSESQTIFAVREDDVEAPTGLVDTLRQAVFDGSVDVTVCYCSVYEECWTSSLQERLNRWRGEGGSGSVARAVESCEAADRSGI